MGFLSDNFIADFFIKALEWIQSFVGSYGWSIVLLTIFFKLLLLPLDIKQKKNMRTQKKLQPQIDAINKKYANDKEMQSKKTMEFYKKEKYSPFSGCLPMLIQLPIFFAFFGALRSIAGNQILAMYELAQTLPPEAIQLESWLWVKNLWQPDTFLASATIIPTFEKLAQQYPILANLTDFDVIMAPVAKLFEGITNGLFILPFAAGGMAFLQSKLTMPAQPQPTAGAQQTNPLSGKTMQYILPLISVFICISYSAAFALYWTVSNIVSVITNIVVEKVLDAKDEAKVNNA